MARDRVYSILDFVLSCFMVFLLPCIIAFLVKYPKPFSRLFRTTGDCSDKMPDFYLKLTTECLKKAQTLALLRISNEPSRFNHELCNFLVNELERVVHSARCYLKLFPTGSPSEDHIARCLETCKLLFVSAKQVESFVQGCSKLDGKSLAAIILPNVSDHILSVGFDLELCDTIFCDMRKRKATKSTRFNEFSADVSEGEVNFVDRSAIFGKRRASLDKETLLTNVKALIQSSELDEEGLRLATFLSTRLERQIGGKIFEVPYRTLVQEGKLGSCVRKAIWLGVPVAVKTFFGDHVDFKKEVAILDELSHPNVLSLLCSSTHDQGCAIVTELMDEDLFSLIQKRVELRRQKRDLLHHGGSPDSAHDPEPRIPPFDDFESVHLILQIAKGMLYLHEKKIVHRDLKSMNILVKGVKASGLEIGYVLAKVGDFGLSKIKEVSSTYSNETPNVGTTRWMAPEMIRLREGNGLANKMKYDPFKADIYGFGMVCYEIVSGYLPFSTISSKAATVRVLLGDRPTIPDQCPHRLKALITNCWNNDASSRPNFDVICDELRLLKYSLVGVEDSGLEDGYGFVKLRDFDLFEETSSTYSNETPNVGTMGWRAPEVNGLANKMRYDPFKADIYELLLRPLFSKLSLVFEHESSTAKAYCPIIFMRNSLQHFWCGYDRTTNTWEPLPPLTNLPPVDIRPLSGKGGSFMGFRITTTVSQLVVGNPFTSEWQTIPKSSDLWGEAGNILLVDRNDPSAFLIIAVREDGTEIFHSKLNAWTKLRQRPPSELQEITTLGIKHKLIGGTLCGSLLFCYGRSHTLVSFDVVAERWMDDSIPLPPHASSKCFQMLECAGNLFAAIYDGAKDTITIWGLVLSRREFFAIAEMPQQFTSLLYKKKISGRRQTQLMAVGHKQCMYFWLNFSNDIIVFDILRWAWDELPQQFNQCESDEQDIFQTYIDSMGSFPDN